jgi:polyisoprenoid-binding protein YceI
MTRQRRIALAALAGVISLSCLTLPQLAAAMFKTDNAKSSVTIIFKQLGVPVEVPFKKFAIALDYNAAKPENAKAQVDIDIGSFDLGDAEYNAEVMKKDWFNAAQFPKARFVSTSLKAKADGSIDVSGKLSIKGTSADIHFPLHVKKEGANQLFEGTIPIKRLAFHIGDGVWKDTDTVADEVLIKFRITAAQ